MKKCPNCKAEVENNFDVCWNCQYSFSEERIIAKKEYDEVCPKCNSVKDANTLKCKNCGYKTDSITDTQFDGTGRVELQLSCLRCNVSMNFADHFKLHEGARIGVLGNLFEFFTNRESFHLYCCPNCGKVEFFLPV